ncbi:TnsA-like heteromeric transposase endonuclease subunit (plasmid) [Rhodococcus pyridinivorans]|uniref:TnsA-like heteromeric transposase endonuclease subunit n=1 Tax=Rhodococcus pyridinivorans TaxID=103816 RepID=UPI001FFE2E0C|nr:TnsA-like heteromeric transposase endonuclease subunit [Rhodococcus pyridinivorans]UPK66551.1 TnsA-like heteromeric transposase endonuclease subunit [Rhodococcus pyridinivorans]
MIRGLPVRKVRSHPDRRHYAGMFWSATNRGHVLYESRLELDRLWLADYAPEVVGIAAQPMWLCGPDGKHLRRHVPDLLLERADGGFTVVDVKPADFARRDAVAQVFAWTEGLCATRGWSYEVWTGADPVVLANLRVLGGARRSEWIDPAVMTTLGSIAVSGRTINDLTAAVNMSGARIAVMAKLWSGVWSVDLTVPLSGQSVVHCETSMP